MDRKPLREPKTPHDEYLYDIASSLRAILDGGTLTAPEQTIPEGGGTVELTEPATLDPSDHSVDEVRDYLDGATDAERDRVLAAEKAGKARKSIVG